MRIELQISFLYSILIAVGISSLVALVNNSGNGSNLL